MLSISTENIPVDQLDAMDAYAQTTGPEVRDLLLSLSQCIRAGAEITAVSSETTFTPNQVAERLGISRTHLYKLLDRGEIVSHRVGRDRRIRLEDLIQFETRRQCDRRELAERFSSQSKTRSAAVDEIADLL